MNYTWTKYTDRIVSETHQGSINQLLIYILSKYKQYICQKKRSLKYNKLNIYIWEMNVYNYSWDKLIKIIR